MVLGLLWGPGCSDDDGKNNKDADVGVDTSNVERSDATDTSAEDTAPDTTEDTGSDGGDTTMASGFRIPGLSAPVDVRLDQWGVLHIDCQTDADCYAAQGYFHADHRFLEMDLLRRQTFGQLSQLIGLTFAADSDARFRRLMTTRKGEKLEDAYYNAVDQETKKMLKAYARGVNAWLADMRKGENGAKLPKEYDFPAIPKDKTDKETFRDWRPQDSIALYLQLAYQLSLSTDGDIGRDKLAKELKPKTAADMLTVKPGLESNTYDASGEMAPQAFVPEEDEMPLVEAFRHARKQFPKADRALSDALETLESTESLVFGPKSGFDGSNNWVVSPNKTKDGTTLLANDPHLSLNNPAIWYYVELNSKTNGNGDLHVAGASIPAVPGIVAGQNEKIAWGVTTARLDLSDAYVEKLTSDGDHVMFNGKKVALVKKDYTIEGKNGNTRTYTFEYVPHHGPLISKDMKNQRGVSIKWVAQKPGNDIDFIKNLMKAENVQEAMDSLKPIRTINQNWVIIDDAGSIGWYPKGAIPKRPWASPQKANWLPLPGQGGAEWQGTVAAKDAPKLKDPAAGFVATANNDFDGSYTDGDPTDETHTPWQAPPANGHRHKRIVEMLKGTDKHTVDTMHEIQSDTYSLHAETLVPEILSIADANTGQLDSDAQKVVSALKAWKDDYTCPTGLDGNDPSMASKVSDMAEATASIGCSTFHVMLPHLTDAVFGDELDATDRLDAKDSWYRLQATLIYAFTNPSALNNGDTYFDDVSTMGTTETKTDIVLSALSTTGKKLQEAFGSGTPDDWRWGRIHTVAFESLFAAAGVDVYNTDPYANDGGYLTVDVANPVGPSGGFEGDFNHRNGPSIRVVFEAGQNGVEGWFQLPGGQVHQRPDTDNPHRDSKWYGSLIDEWLANDSKKLLFEPSDVKMGAEKTYTVRPAQ